MAYVRAEATHTFHIPIFSRKAFLSSFFSCPFFVACKNEIAVMRLLCFYWQFSLFPPFVFRKPPCF